MDVWNAAGARFEFVVDSRSPSSITCDELGEDGWIALTHLRPLGAESNIAQVLISLNTQQPFTPPHPTTTSTIVSEPYDLYTVLLHEMGHALHLGEDYGIPSDTVMRPTISPGEVRGLAEDDIRGIKLLYP
ncbi:MAG: matrixin family metalloprotease [Edaphobacter sp.]